MNNAATIMRRFKACNEAVEWAGRKSAKGAWQKCERGDWMLWIAAKAGIDRKALVLAACACAEPALKHVRAGDDRPRLAIETARAWCRGEATIKEVRKAVLAADAAADAAAYAAYAVAAYAADAYAADAYAAADAAAYAAYAAAYAAYAAAAVRARRLSLKQSADIVRSMIPWSDIERLIK